MAVHGRTWPRCTPAGRTGTIRAVKEAGKIPVIANGDVFAGGRPRILASHWRHGHDRPGGIRQPLAVRPVPGSSEGCRSSPCRRWRSVDDTVVRQFQPPPPTRGRRLPVWRPATTHGI